MTSPQRLTVLALALILTSPGARALDPTDPGAALRLEQEQRERQLQEDRLRQAPPTRPEITLPATPAPGAVSEEKNIPVRGFEVGESAILTADEIRAALAPYLGQTVSLKDLYDAVAAINRLYQEREMPTARAFLPPQEVKDGVVRIRLVEARVGQLRVTPTQRLPERFITDRISLQTGQLMSVPILEDDLARFNRLHEAQLRAGVAAGKAPGTTDIEITAAEPQPFELSMFADNAGRHTLGQGRLGLTGTLRDPLKRGDRLDFSATATEGSHNYYLAYGLPLTADDLRLDVSYSDGDINIIRGTFEPLDISGQSKDFTIGLTRPLVVSPTRLWNAYARLSARESISEFGGVAQNNLDLGVLSLGLSGESRAGDAVTMAEASAALGTGLLGGERHFHHYRASVTRIQPLGERWQLILRGGAQYSPTRDLPGSELFQVGGAYTVRGYSEGIVSGRSGYYASIEARYALRDPAQYLLQAPEGPRANAIVFLDHGGAFPYLAGGQAHGADYVITGAGTGLLFELNNRVSGRLVVAWPLGDSGFETDDREPRLHLQLVAKLF